MKGNSGLIVPILIITISLLTDWYLLQGLKTLLLPLKQPFLRQTIIILFRVVSIGIIVGTIVGGYVVMVKGEYTLLFRVFIHAFLIFMTAKIAFIIILSGEDIYRLIKGIVTSIGQGHLILPSRNFFVSFTGFSLFLVVIMFFAYGMFFERSNYKVHRKTIYFENLPESFNGTTIVQISDFHAGSFHNRKEVLKGIEIIKSLKPDIFVFTGDMVNNLAEEILPWVAELQGIHAPLGKYSVIGNHDYGDYVRWKNMQEKDANLEKLKQYEQNAGFEVLVNKHVPIVKGSDTIYIAGVENWGHTFIRKGDLKTAMQGIDNDDFVILLSHDPSHWDAEVKHYSTPIALTLSGHTHGFQVGIEYGKIKWSPVQWLYKNWSGLAEENGKYLYVNRGFGFIGYEGRIGIPPEITLIELRRK